jgi:hypothetical protein
LYGVGGGGDDGEGSVVVIVQVWAELRQVVVVDV